jgi:hypothetical protein
VFLTSRWFPLILATLQIIRHLGFIGYDYWIAAHNLKYVDLGKYVRGDLERPLFDSYEFCGAWRRYGLGQSVDLGLDFPAYAAGTLLASAINRKATCVDALMTPRGQIICAVFIPPLWFLVGLSVCRLARHRWRPQVKGRVYKALMSLGLVALPFGILALLFSIAGLFVSDLGLSARLVGFAFWLLYLPFLAAERLRFWPFATHRDDRPAPAPIHS